KTMSDLWSESHTSPGLLRPERRRSVGFQAKYSKDSGQVTEHRHIMSLSLVIGQFHLLASQVVSIPGFCGSPALIPPEPCKKLWRTPRRSGHYLCNDWESHPGKTAATCCCQHFAMNGITDQAQPLQARDRNTIRPGCQASIQRVLVPNLAAIVLQHEDRWKVQRLTVQHNLIDQCVALFVGRVLGLVAFCFDRLAYLVGKLPILLTQSLE